MDTRWGLRAGASPAAMSTHLCYLLCASHSQTLIAHVPSRAGPGLQQAAGRHGDQAVSDAPPTCTPFLPRGQGTSRVLAVLHHRPGSACPGARSLGLQQLSCLPEALASHLWLPWQLGTLPPKEATGSGRVRALDTGDSWGEGVDSRTSQV